MDIVLILPEYLTLARKNSMLLGIDTCQATV